MSFEDEDEVSAVILVMNLIQVMGVSVGCGVNVESIIKIINSEVMTSMDLRDAEVQQHFTAMRKSSRDFDKEVIASEISRMYESNEEYSYGIFTRIIKFIAESNDKEEKKIGLISLASLAPKMQGNARSIFVNKFHSPVFKLIEVNTDESLVPHIEKAYEAVMQLGGNRNDSAIESNLSSCFSILESGSAKEVRKIGAYSLIKVLVMTSPYITFRKFMQKQKNSNLDNLSLVIAASRVKNIKVRTAYLAFLGEYIKYIAEKKDHLFQKVSFERFFENVSITAKDNNQELNHLYIETVHIFLTFLNGVVPNDKLRLLLEYSLEKVQNNKNQVIERSLIKLLPKLCEKGPSNEIISSFLKYLRSMEGESKVLAYAAINQIIEKTGKNINFLSLYQDLLNEILAHLKLINRKDLNYGLYYQLFLLETRTIDILIKKYEGEYEALISSQKLEELVSYAMIVGLDEQIIKLITDIVKFNIHGLGRILEIKFIITLSKILTGSTKKVLRVANAEFKNFMQLLETREFQELLDKQANKIKAIEALSKFKFRQEFRDVIGGFVKDCVLKYYIQWGSSKMKIASVQAAFFLHPKKGKQIAESQILQILDKLIRVGINDDDSNVRQKVFSSIVKNFKRHQQFIHLFSNMSLLNSLFKALQDRNQKIRIQTLKIICILYKRNPSMYITPFLNQYLYRCFYHLSSNFKYYNQKYYIIKSIVVIIEYAPSIIANHIDNLLKLLLKYLSDKNNYDGLQELFFQLIKALAARLPNTLVPYAQEFSAHLVEAMKDKLNTKKRQSALKTFLSIIKECGYVVLPYFQISSLKETLAFLIRSQIEQESRVDIMKIIGALGAFDHLRFSMILQGSRGSAKPVQMMKSLSRLNAHSNFLNLRSKLLRERQNSFIDLQLKQYYDELILQQNSKKLIVFNTKQHSYDAVEQKEMPSQQRLELELDSSMNFNMIILKVLFQILGDQSLEEKHSLTLDVLAQLLDIMGAELQRELPKIMDLLLKIIEQNEQTLNLIYIIGQKCDISNYVAEIVTIVINRCKNIKMMVKVLGLITGKYPQSLRHLVECIVDKLHTTIQNHFDDSILIVEISFIYQNIRAFLEPYLNIIIPQITDKFFKKNSQITNSFIDFFMNLAKCSSSILQFMPILAYHFSHLLSLCKHEHSQCKPCLRNKICNCIVLFITLFKADFATYLPMLHKSIIKTDTMHELYNKAIRYLQICIFGNIHTIFNEDDLQKMSPEYRGNAHPRIENPKFTKMIEGVEELMHEFDPTGKKIIDEDWMEWLKKNSIFLLKKSPNIILRTCSVLADQYNQLGLELYNISFYYFWEVLIDDQKKILIDHIKKILTYNPKPFLLVRKTFLNLAEFMSRKKCSFELSSSLLAECAGQSSSFAKQLYYKQLQFQANPERTLQSMIDTYMKLGQAQNAFGLLSIAKNLQIKCKIQWYQKIGKFDEAYKSYLELPEETTSNQKLKCLSHISDQKFVQEFERISKNNFGYLSADINEMAIEAYAHLQEWDKFEAVLSHVQNQGHQKPFWMAILDIKKKNYEQALTEIQLTRKNLYEQIPDLVSFSSSSEAFDKLITLQQLFELQEIVALKQKQQKINSKIKAMDEVQKIKTVDHFQAYCLKLKDIWNDRLLGCYKSSVTYKKLSIVRSLVFDKNSYFEFYYELCEIYIKEKRINKCEQLINKMKKELNDQNMAHKLKLVHLLETKLNFSANLIKQVEAVGKIQTFLQKNVQLHPQKIGELYFLSGLTLYENKQDDLRTREKILNLIEKSAKLCNTYKQWYIFSALNIQFAETAERSETIQKYISNALYSLITSLKITAHENEFYLQGYLKLLSLLCKYSRIKSIYTLFQEQYKNIPVEGWINVVPQMIAQLYQVDTQSNFVRLLKMLLKQLGEQHPESVLFSLNFALKSKIEERVRPAKQIVDHIRINHSELADQIEKIASELGRTAIKLKEYWYDGIESAWSSYNQTKNSAQVIANLKQLCETVLNRKDSNSQISFHQEFGQDIRDGYSWLLRYEKTHQPTCLSMVFQIFYGIYRKVKDCFDNIRKVYLKNVAPFLVTSKRYRSTIPGMYEPNKTCIKISGFRNELTILQSKQRPRKLTIYGDDGKQYNFLLKGRQDLRLDERVMQFFSLVNKLLAGERENLRRNLQITRYSIVPLTVNTGLIGWVQNCDTLNELIKEFRSLNKIRVYVQKQLYEKVYPDYAYLPVINKLQIFRMGLQSTQGKDLQKILWMKSPNSEVWIEKRNNYTCSLATMSMVGYILGLGDRHPSNIMLNRNSGKIVHIDFGDCFEVAVLREKFPEKVPFRLTRMLQKAMGVPGIHGLFSFTCQKVMRILRENKQSLYGVLETFAHDPIISWRLTNDKKDEDTVDAPRNIKNINDEVLGSIMEGFNLEMTEAKHKNSEIEEESPRRTLQTNDNNQQQINQKAIKALQRVKNKLRGADFDEREQLSVEQQVSRLIQEATSAINICQSWPGWCPFW